MQTLLVFGEIIMGCMLVWTVYDCWRKGGCLYFGRALVNIILAAYFITVRLNSGLKGDLICFTTFLAIILWGLAVAEFVVYMVRKRADSEVEKSD